MRLHIYAGPVVLVERTPGFNPNDFCYETCNERLTVMPEDDCDTHHVLLPNANSLCAKSRNWANDNAVAPSWYSPEMQDDVDWFSAAAKDELAKIPVPHEVAWAVVKYWR
ncbi:MAG: hypothetical protein JSS66_06335 [Armatimonadetes bacterium]|nr:hypothetical protein [Armatimonadota bacterium]